MNYTKKTFLTAMLGIVIATSGYGQKKQFTITEATNGMVTTLAPKGIKKASWQPGTANLWYRDKKDGNDVWVVTDHANGGASIYIEPGTYPVKVNDSVTLKWLDKANAYLIDGNNILIGHLTGTKWTWALTATLPGDAENIVVDKSRRIAYTIDNNVYIHDKGAKRAVSSEADKNVVCGKTVHREEFGIDKGIFFSPDGRYIAYYRMDQTMVKDYPIVKWDVVPAKADIIKYPMAGGTSHEVTLRVYDITTGKTITLRTGTEKDHYLTGVTWGPDSRYIYVGILNRGQDHLWLNRYDARTGDKTTTLFEETDDKYVHPMHGLTFISGSNNEFVWWSDRDGYTHLYLYTNGIFTRQLTKGDWVVNELVGVDAAGRKLVITTSKGSPLEKHIYTVGLDNSKLERIDKDPGMHNAICSPDGKYVLDVYSATGIPRNTYVHATSGNYSKEILKAENTLAAYERPEIRQITLTAADGVTPLYGKLILPVGFNKNKKYPVIVYLYNGPNVQLLHNSFPESGNLWYEYMAQHGYIIFTMDGRGSSNRGMAFEQATFRHLGDAELEDQLRGVDYLRSLPYVDSKRMGIHGWSYGGFMTTAMMLKHPGIFKCAVAGGPVMDWKLYEVMYTERYMDMPKDNPKGYEHDDLLSKVKDLQGKLMLIHGTSDNVVVWQQSLSFIKKCVDEGVQIDYFVYPGHEHNVRGKDRVHLMQKISDYFDLYLKP